ncbi:growth hormone receptor b isoform X2 [Cheilinus undulatus]|nr:growth hormone receptor b isoform X2 [Cheilinus undulatus]
MAAALPALLFFLHISSSSALNSSSQEVVPQRSPHLAGCFSTNMETFRCRWNVGTFRNVSKPGDLRLLYINKKPPLASPKEWSECPHYTTDRPNECFFNENHTSIWTYYSVQLRSKDEAVLYDEDFFHVQDIVKPDPPESLNWTLLNVSSTSMYYDIILSWRPPQSADVESGWMTLEYEVHYRDVSSDKWEKVESVKGTHCSIYGLESNVNHEVRVRCRMLGWRRFGEFSDSVFVHIPSKASRFPVVALLIFGALCLVAILMLVIILQQEKLMVILLPPVPGPKIRGIDPELLKKGKLRELTSILGGPPDLRPELYNNDPWVEFIDLDIEEQTDRLTDLDTDCLMQPSLSSNSTPLTIGFRDDDSGRASCCDPDLPSDPEASPFHPLIPNQNLNKEELLQNILEPSSSVQGPTTEEPLFEAAGREAMYTQVSEVRSSGKVLLSPEEPVEVDKTMCKDIEKEEKVEKEKEFQLIVVDPDHGGYTSDLNKGKTSPGSSLGDDREPCEPERDLSSPSPYHETDTTPASTLAPAPVYTVVERVDMQNSLLLTPNSTPAPQLIIPKTMPTPDGYLTPELLGSITP